MVSRYGVSKEGAVGVAVGALAPMHMLPCSGTHHHHPLTASHPQNPQPGHNHHVHPGHQPPPPPSPSPHLNQLTHPQLTVNISHLGHHHHQHHQQQPPQQQPPQQQQQTQMPPQYRIAANRSEFHGNYSAQPGSQVGGNAASNVGVPTGRGPPPLGGIQTIGQSAAGIPPGGPAGGQAPSQAPTPGVQSQPPQGPAPTTTPPVHTPSPQEMGKQAHLQTQQQSLQQVYVSTQNRPASQSYYQTGPRPQQPRGLSHRGGQGASGTPVVGMAGVGGGGGQPPAIYPHPAGLPVQASSAMYLSQSQVHSLHTGPHQQSVYPINSQIPIHQFSGPPQRHQPQNQSFYQTFQTPPPMLPNVFAGYHAPTQHGYYYAASNTMSLTRASTSAVSGGAQHVAGPLAGTQGAPVIPQGTLQQPTQQAQPLPPMGIPLSQTDVYSGHNGGVTNTNSTTRSRKPRGQNAILDIVNPLTGKNISDEIYKDNETTQSGESSNRETPQPQNNGAEVIADFAARVAKAATEGSETVSTSASETAPNTIQTTAQTSLSNIHTNSANDTNSRCSSSPPMTKNIAGAGASKTVSTINSQSSLGTCSNATQSDSNIAKTESKALQLPVKEFQPRSEIKSVTIEESSPVVSSVVAVANKDTISVQLTAPIVNTETTAVTATVMAETESETVGTTGAVTAAGVGTASGTGSEAAKHLNASCNVVLATPHWSNVTQEIPKPSATASTANPVPTREPFPNLASKTSSNSPPRRKPNATELPSNTKEQKERKTREKSLGSRGATPTPVVHNQAADHHHQKTNGDAAGDKTEAEVVHPRNEIQQKPSDGKAMQKQKSKNKVKLRELNRKGAEKEGTDMDAFVNTVSTAKTAENKQDNKEQHAPAPKDSNKESNKEISKDIKEQDYESKKEKEILPVHAKTEKHVSTEVSKDSTPAQQAPHVVEKPPISKDSSTKSEDSTFNALPATNPNDVVDHAAVIEEMHLEAMVAQKNEENFKVSALHASNDEKATTIPSVNTEKKQEVEVSSDSGNAPSEIAAPNVNKAAPPLLKYFYKEGQWSPVNMTGRKSYDREFLLRLQFDPHSKQKPANLPNLQAVLKDSLQNTHNTMDLRAFKDANITRHDSLMPGFAKANISTRPPPTSRKSESRGKPKPNNKNVITFSLSLREDVKLRETENAWKPTRLKQLNQTEEEAKSEALYKRVRSVLNKLTPQKFSTLVEQVRSLPIDTQERLQGVINLVFEKAVDEPSFSVEYALLCKELAQMEVAGYEGQDSSVSFKKLIITRCQKEFEKNPIDDVARNRKLKEIDDCHDLEKKKELQLALEEEERRIRVKSVGNIRFIGELYRQQILTTKIMHRCIRHLLDQNDEDNLECLCKLLTTIGKDLELKGQQANTDEMQEYFNRMQEIVARKGHSKISSRIRFMLQDVIDLRANKWIPRRNDNNPKTIDQIQKEAESERLDMQVNSVPLNTARKDDRNNDRKRNRGLGGPTDDGWSQPVGRVRPATYSVETAKLKNKPPPMDDMQLGNRASYLWRATNPSNNSKTISSNKFACLENMSNLDQDKRMPPLPLSGSRSTGPRECSRDYKSYDGRSSRNGTQSGSASSRESHSLLDTSQTRKVSMLPPVLKSASQSGAINHKAMSEQEFTKAYNSILKHYMEEPIIENTALEIQQKFDSATFAKLTRECINHVLEKSPIERELISKLLSHLLRQKILPVECFKNGLGEVLEIVDDLVIDIPKIWTYIAEILSHSIEDGAIALSELESTCISLRRQGFVGKFLGELLMKVSRNKGPKWLADKWDQSNLQLHTLIDPERENAEKIIQEYNLEFLTGDYNSAEDSTVIEQLSLEKIQENLVRLMQENTSFDEICSWITANVGDRKKDPMFIRHLMTAILQTTLERPHGAWKLNIESFISLQTLIQRFVDANELLELQCLYAIQKYMKLLEFPPGVLVAIMNRLWMDNVISSDAFLTWQRKKPTQLADKEGHSVCLVTLTSFFTDLQEPDDNSSLEELSTSANQGC
ncbi:PREDICTED: eukaryotic translation initiation factor 4 gamma 3 isoform X1 [Trachymyrmex septentrionalis]|uniref:eukaryotic translation initiation factor 4 gamma 3 isoform X1 n=1 Tax=Trachymyrmex septentrionalis TaxID=34720 RepID=UPI00084F128A|nr:PREDICTED: eukaryotic translation initiation factor 4 gamma 3 isoform X1 [Trachymyrmex septentrionalis]